MSILTHLNLCVVQENYNSSKASLIIQISPKDKYKEVHIKFPLYPAKPLAKNCKNVFNLQ